MSNMIFKKAITTDAKALTELTIRSKSYWNYSAGQIEEWRDDLTITPNYIDDACVYILFVDSQLIGYYSYLKLDADKVKLDNIFLEPDCIGKGLGIIMMNHLIENVKNLGYSKVVLDSEPNAEGFYKNYGFKVTGRLESSITDRFLPIMELDL